MSGISLSQPYPKSNDSSEMLAIKRKINKVRDSADFQNPWATGHNEARAEYDALYEQRDALEKAQAATPFTGAPK